MYLLFKNVNQQQLGIIQLIGRFEDFTTGYIPDTHTDIVDIAHLKAEVITEEEAYAYMFIGTNRGYLSVRSGTAQNVRLGVCQSEEADGEKKQYTMTDEDKAATVSLTKKIMRMKLHSIFDKRLEHARRAPSELEAQSFADQKEEALAWRADNETPTPLLDALAQARGIETEEMVAKVIAAIADQKARVTELLSRKQAIEAEIKSCETIGDTNRIMHNRFALEMPRDQKEEEGVETEATFDI